MSLLYNPGIYPAITQVVAFERPLTGRQVAGLVQSIVPHLQRGRYASARYIEMPEPAHARRQQLGIFDSSGQDIRLTPHPFGDVIDLTESYQRVRISTYRWPGSVAIQTPDKCRLDVRRFAAMFDAACWSAISLDSFPAYTEPMRCVTPTGCEQVEVRYLR